MKLTEKAALVFLGCLAGSMLVPLFQLDAPQAAFGQAAPGEDSGWLMATGTLSDGGSVCFLFDTRNCKLGAYSVKSTQLHLLAIRLCTYDYHADQFPASQKPSVADMKRASEKHASKKATDRTPTPDPR